MDDAAARRSAMVSNQIAARGIRAPAVLQAMGEVPRERFVDGAMAEFAYDDSPLPIGEAQTISQPYIVAAMIEAAEVGAGDTVLEVGAGSGYATAVLSRIAGRVCAVERHASLVETAIERLEALGCRNVDLRQGDGSLGWPEARASFDAIIVSAAAPGVPPALKVQLAPGGRLVVPVGDAERQQLVKLTRTGEDDYDQEIVMPVRFVPLVGAQGWAEGETGAAGRPAAGRAARRTLEQRVADATEPLPELGDAGAHGVGVDDDAVAAFGGLFDRFADRRVVLLGECSHGTSEFYRARAAITRHLVQQHGFDIVAVEADWPDAAAVDRDVRGLGPAPHRPPPPFQRFPRWMWRNAEFAAFVRWLRGHNAALPPERRTRFHGLDLYNLRCSIAAVLGYLAGVDPELAQAAKERYGCLMPWQKDPATYGRAALRKGYAECENAVVEQCREFMAREFEWARADPDGFLDAAQSARLVAAAERYYRVMYHGGAASWNLRDEHMAQTLASLLEFKGPHSRAVVWAHNSHIGDARHTEMGRQRGEHNLGQLARQRFGDDAVALVGFGTHTGTVAAADDWDGEMSVMPVRPSLAGSVERVFHDAGRPRCLLDLRPGRHEAVRQWLREPRLERYIGVVYRPHTERWSHYAESSLADQYDAFAWFDETRAVTPLGPEPPHREEDAETYPFGV